MAENIDFEFDIVVTRGDARELPLEFYDDDESDLDVTTWSFFYTAKESNSDTDADAVVTKDPLDLVVYDTNKVKLMLSETDTDINPQDYIHDLQVINSAGTLTIGKGKLVIEEQTTVRVAAMP